MSDYKKVSTLTPEQRAYRTKLTTLSQIRWAMKKKGLDPDDPAVLKDYVLNHCQSKTYDRLFRIPLNFTATDTGKKAQTKVIETGLASPGAQQNTVQPNILCTVNVGLVLDSESLDKLHKEITAKLGTLDVHLKLDNKEIAEISALLKEQIKGALQCEDVSPFEALWLIADQCRKTCTGIEVLIEEVKKRENL